MSRRNLLSTCYNLCHILKLLHPCLKKPLVVLTRMLVMKIQACIPPLPQSYLGRLVASRESFGF